MAGWYHWLNGHEFGWTPGVGDGQGGLECCNSWGLFTRLLPTSMNTIPRPIWNRTGPRAQRNPLSLWTEGACRVFLALLSWLWPGSTHPQALRADYFPSGPPGKPMNTRVGSHSFHQENFLTQGLNPGPLCCRQILYCLNHQRTPLRPKKDTTVCRECRSVHAESKVKGIS